MGQIGKVTHDPSKPYQISWYVSSMWGVEYKVYGPQLDMRDCSGCGWRMTLCREFSDYVRTIYNGDDLDFEKEIKNQEGILHHSSEMVPFDLLDQFNEDRAASYVRHLDYCRLHEIECSYVKPEDYKPVVTGYFDHMIGTWRKVTDPAAYDPKASHKSWVKSNEGLETCKPYGLLSGDGYQEHKRRSRAAYLAYRDSLAIQRQEAA